MVQAWIAVLIAVATMVIGAFVGFLIRKKIGESKIGSAEEEAKRILSESSKNADARKKELLLEAKEETLRLRNETERELKERRAEVSRMERRLNQKEENLDKKTETLERKTEQLEEKLKANDALKEKINTALAELEQEGFFDTLALKYFGGGEEAAAE